MRKNLPLAVFLVGLGLWALGLPAAPPAPTLAATAANLPAADVVLVATSVDEAEKNLAPFLDRLSLALPHLGFRHLDDRLKSKMGVDLFAHKGPVAFVRTDDGFGIWALKKNASHTGRRKFIDAWAKKRWGGKRQKSSGVTLWRGESPDEGPALLGERNGWLFLAPDGCGDLNGTCLRRLMGKGLLSRDKIRFEDFQKLDGTVGVSVKAKVIRRALAPLVGKKTAQHLGHSSWSIQGGDKRFSFSGRTVGKSENLGLVPRNLSVVRAPLGGLSFGVKSEADAVFLRNIENSTLGDVFPFSPTRLSGGLKSIQLGFASQRRARPWPAKTLLKADYEKMSTPLRLLKETQGGLRDGATFTLNGKKPLGSRTDSAVKDALSVGRLDPGAIRSMLLLIPLGSPDVGAPQQLAVAAATSSGALAKRLGELSYFVQEGDADRLIWQVNLALKGRVRGR
jgi:hypothetical protein